MYGLNQLDEGVEKGLIFAGFVFKTGINSIFGATFDFGK
jgi:hypothetical protein